MEICNITFIKCLHDEFAQTKSWGLPTPLKFRWFLEHDQISTCIIRCSLVRSWEYSCANLCLPSLQLIQLLCDSNLMQLLRMRCTLNYWSSRKDAFASLASLLQINFWHSFLSSFFHSAVLGHPRSWSWLITKQIQYSALAVRCCCYFPSGCILWPWQRCIHITDPFDCCADFCDCCHLLYI